LDAGAVTACAIVQARMGSSRFPGKMLREIAGKPLIWHVIHRLRQCRTVTQIILATSDQSGDDGLAAYVQSLGIAVVRGSEKNVLQRFTMALKLTDADIILRVTGDSPLIDPALIDRLVAHLGKSGADYVLCSEPVSDCGIDPVARRALQRLITERADHPAAVEHVTGYFQVEPDFARREAIPVTGENRLVEGARFSVDTPADLAFMEAVYRRLGAVAGEAKFLDVLALLRAEPELLTINGHIRQRRASEKPLSVLIRCDGGHSIGLGHIVRCLAIAAILRDRFSAAVTFALGGDEAAFALVRGQAFPVHAIRGLEPGAELAAVLARVLPDIALMDMRTPFDPAEIAATRDANRRLAVLDDGSARRLHADVSFFPPSGALLDWSGARGERCIGFDWIPLREQFSPPPARNLSQPPLAIILSGGSDPTGIGRRFLSRAVHALPPDWQIGIVIGPAAVADKELEALVRRLGTRLTVHRRVSDMAGLMAKADLALAAFGMTAYELAAVGVPMLLLCLTDDHCRSAAALAERGAAYILGTAPDVADDAIDQALVQVSTDARLRAEMSRNAQHLVDGLGATRIADRIAALAQHAKYAAALAR
jgi:spore coat polysaccharide biosynthesis protein SpsF